MLIHQLRLGCALMKDQEERYKLADLLCKAGTHATKSASFDEAMSHYLLGIELLGPRHWRDEYYLSLELFTGAAKVAYCNGNHEKTHALTSTIIQHGRDSVHKMRAYMLQMETRMALTDNPGAYRIGLEASAQTAYRLPKRVGFVRVLMELPNRMLERLSDDMIKRLPKMDEDSEEAQVVMLFMSMHPAALSENQLLAAIIPMRAIQIIIRNGLCKAAPVAFAVYALMLANHLGQFELGQRLARISTALLESLNAYEWMARVSLVSYSYVYSIWEPMENVLEHLNRAFLTRLMGGDLTMALGCASHHAFASITISVPLEPLVDTMKSNLELMIERQGEHSFSLSLLLGAYQCALNLMKPSTNPVKLEGDLMNEEEFLAANEGSPGVLAYLYYYKFLLACHFNEYKFAEYLIAKVNEGIKLFPPHTLTSFTLYSGIGYAVLSKNRTRLRLRLVKKSHQRLKKLGKHSGERYRGHLHMLEAEIAAIRGNTNRALALVEQAMDALLTHGFTNLAGLACERAFTWFVDDDDQRPAMESMNYLCRAAQLYQQWGAHAKVAQLLPRLSQEAREQLTTVGHGSCPATPESETAHSE